MPEVIYQGDLPAFTGRNVPIKEIASAIGKDAQYVRLGIIVRINGFGKKQVTLMKKQFNREEDYE